MRPGSQTVSREEIRYAVRSTKCGTESKFYYRIFIAMLRAMRRDKEFKDLIKLTGNMLSD